MSIISNVTHSQTSSFRANVPNIVPNEVYMMQNALDACTRNMQSLLNQYAQRQRLYMAPVTMVLPVDVLVMDAHTQQYPRSILKKHVQEKLSPLELEFLEESGLMENLLEHYENAIEIINQDEIYGLLHQESLYQNAYRQRYIPSDSYTIGDGMLMAEKV